MAIDQNNEAPGGDDPFSDWAEALEEQKQVDGTPAALDSEQGGPGVSEFLCKRDGLQLTQIRSPNSMVNRFSAAFQSRIGMLHFWLMLRKAR